MNASVRRNKYQPTRNERALAAVLALITSVLGLAAWLALRTFVISPLAAAWVAPLARSAVNDVFLIVLGILWVMLVYLSFYAYQRAVARRRLWPLFARITLIEVATPLLGAGLVFWLVGSR